MGVAVTTPCVHMWVLEPAELTMSDRWGDFRDGRNTIGEFSLRPGAWGTCKKCRGKKYFDGGSDFTTGGDFNSKG